MPTITFYLPQKYGETKDDILLIVNEDRPEERKLQDIADFEREQLRFYITNFQAVYKRWDLTRQIQSRNGKYFTFKPDMSAYQDFPENSVAPNEIRDYKRALTLGGKMTDELKKAAVFYKQMLPAMRDEERLHPSSNPLPIAGFEESANSLGELISSVVEDGTWRVFFQKEQKELEEEDKKIKEDEKKPLPKETPPAK